MILLLLLAVAPDEQRSAWRHRAEVSLAQSATPGAFAVVSLPPSIVSASQKDGADWRLLTAAGDEIPYATIESLSLDQPHEFTGEIIDTRAVPKKSSAWTVDFQAPRAFDTIELGIDAQDFSKIVKVEAATDRTGTWQTLSDGATVFDVLWSPRVHHTSLSFKTTHARYVRITFDDRTSPAIPLRSVVAREQGDDVEARFTAIASLSARQTRGEDSVYTFGLPDVTFDTLTIESTTPTFSRDVTLLRGIVTVDHGTIYRYAKGAAAGARTSFAVHAASSSAWEIQIAGDAAAPLKDVTVHVSGMMPRLVFPVADAGPWTLYFGNADTRAAHYDTDAFRASLGEHPDFAIAHVGAASDNPRFAKPPPLRFVATVGARLDLEHYRLSRKLILPNSEDIYAVTLLPEEVAAARDDLGDVRIADAESHQIPYVRADEWIEKPLAMEFTRGDTSAHVDRYTLKSARPTIATALLLSFSDTTYFSRVIRVIDPEAGARHESRVIFESRFTRQEEKQTPVRVPLDGTRHASLILEIDNGDNQPLSLASVQALVRVPSLAFKAKAGAPVSLLVGNANATLPDYDIASLRQLVLAYTATPVEAEPSVDNPGFRRNASDYFRDAPPTLVIWGALIVLLAVLLLLTVRLVRKA